jgi:SAM-dependent methyltransferase
MAQRLISEFVGDVAKAIELPEPIVEFGSLQVEADQDGDLRPLFTGRDFVGTDMRPGPGVDRVEDLRGLSYGDGEVGTALCLDTLEHCADPRAACQEMHRVLAPGGICVIASVMLWGIHGYPNDYWRFTPEGFRVLLEPFDDAVVGAVGDPDIPYNVVAVGAKGRQLEGLDLGALPSLKAAQERWDNAWGKLRLGPFRLSLAEAMQMLAQEGPRATRQLLRERVDRARAGLSARRRG